MRRKIVIASPREPCGATWLINCFLELGILTYRGGSWDKTWVIVENGHYCLLPEQDILKKWLPSLSLKDSFIFRDDIEVEWVHEWPHGRFTNDKIIYFHRDPRDALYSRYKRESPAIDFFHYVNFLDPHTLLTKLETNLIFSYLWSQHPEYHKFSFEEYKNNPKDTLQHILNYLEILISDEMVIRAIEESTSDKATEAEVKWIEARQHESDKYIEALQIVNQGGKVGRWQELTGKDKQLMLDITTLENHIIHQTDGGLILKTFLCFIKQGVNLSILNYPFDLHCEKNTSRLQDLKMRAIEFSKKLTGTQIDAAGVFDHEAKILIQSLAYETTSSKDASKNLENIWTTRYGSLSELYFILFKKTGTLYFLFQCTPAHIFRRGITKARRLIGQLLKPCHRIKSIKSNKSQY